MFFKCENVFTQKKLCDIFFSFHKQTFFSETFNQKFFVVLNYQIIDFKFVCKVLCLPFLSSLLSSNDSLLFKKIFDNLFILLQQSTTIYTVQLCYCLMKFLVLPCVCQQIYYYHYYPIAVTRSCSFRSSKQKLELD